MAIIRKDKYLKDIANRVGRGSMFFEADDRPALLMGGHQVYVSSVGFDTLSGEMTYAVSNLKGEVLPSARGSRRLGELDIRSLASVSEVVSRYSDLRRERTRNLVNVETRMRQITPSKRPVKGVSF